MLALLLAAVHLGFMQQTSIKSSREALRALKYIQVQLWTAAWHSGESRKRCLPCARPRGPKQLCRLGSFQRLGWGLCRVQRSSGHLAFQKIPKSYMQGKLTAAHAAADVQKSFSQGPHGGIVALTVHVCVVRGGTVPSRHRS